MDIEVSNADGGAPGQDVMMLSADNPGKPGSVISDRGSTKANTGTDIARLMEKYGKGKSYMPPDLKKQYKKDGFRVRFRLSKAYRGLEKQEVVASRPEIDNVKGRKRRRRMADLMNHIESEMMLPDPDEIAKEKLMKLQSMRQMRQKAEAKEDRKKKEKETQEQLNHVIHTEMTSARTESPRRSQYMMEYWGKPSKKNMKEKGDWRSKGNGGVSAWWHKFTKKKPKIVMGPQPTGHESKRKATPMGVLSTGGDNAQMKGYEKTPAGDNKNRTTEKTAFFITNGENSYSAVDEWQRRSSERQMTKRDRQKRLKSAAQPVANNPKQNTSRSLDNRKTNIQSNGKKDTSKVAEQKSNMLQPASELSLSWLAINVTEPTNQNEKISSPKSDDASQSNEKGLLHVNDTLTQLEVGSTTGSENKKGGSDEEGSVKSKYSFMASLGGIGALSHRSRSGSSVSSVSSSSLASDSESEASLDILKEVLDRTQKMKLGGNNNSRVKSYLSSMMGGRASCAGSVKSGRSGILRSVTFNQNSDKPQHKHPATSLDTGLPGQVFDVESPVRITVNGEPRHALNVGQGESENQPTKTRGAKLARTHSAPAGERRNRPSSVKSSENEMDQSDLDKPLKTCRYMYTMCNCQRVGKMGTLAKLQQRRRKSVGVITIYGCPSGEEQPPPIPSVCPFCSVFPKKRIEAWLKDVVVV